TIYHIVDSARGRLVRHSKRCGAVGRELKSGRRRCENEAAESTMKLRADLFRAGAAECYATAQKVKTLEVSRAYLELAQGWRELPDEIERLDRNRPKHLREQNVKDERSRQLRRPIGLQEPARELSASLHARGRRSSAGGR